MKHRHIARQAALQVLTSLLLNDENPKKLVSFVHKEFAAQLSNTDFLEELVHGVLENRKNIDEKIQEFAPEWPIDKLDPVERSILEIGSYEIIHSDTPGPVIINEAVDLAKEFGDDTAGKFINGVLSSVGRDCKKLTETET